MRRLILKFGDPLIESQVGARKIYLPFSHELPIALSYFHHYNLNLVRIASVAQRKYGDMKFIDVGANVGDTVAMLRPRCHFPVLCIEGERPFFNILLKNLPGLGDVEVEQCFLGDRSAVVQGVVDNSHGTAQLHIDNGNGTHSSSLEIKTLKEVLIAHPRFRASKMIKIDTDGFDCIIIRGAQDYLREEKPILFFEYDPYCLARNSDDGLSIFPALDNWGYHAMLVYDNVGDFMLSTDVNDGRRLEEIHNYFKDKAGQSYCDICVFHKDDQDLFEELRTNEVKRRQL